MELAILRWIKTTIIQANGKEVKCTALESWSPKIKAFKRESGSRAFTQVKTFDLLYYI